MSKRWGGFHDNFEQGHGAQEVPRRTDGRRRHDAAVHRGSVRGGVGATAAAAEIDYFGPPEPATVLTMALFRNGGDQDELQGLLCESPRTCVSVPFPYLQRSIGVDDLDEAIHGDTFGQRQIVFGYSQGARVATDWLEEFAAAEDAPSADDLSFVLIGNPPGRKYGGAHVIWHHVTPDTQYQVLDVARQYDLTADRPDRFSLLAMANAYAGGLVQLHGHYEDVDIYDPANYVWKEGNTTYVFVPTEDLPILNGLRRLGLDELADQLQGPLKEKIEKAYDRSYLPAESGWPAEVEPEPEEPPVDPPAESKQTFLTSARSVQTISAEEPTARQESDPDLDVGSLSSDDELGARIDEVDGQPADDADEDTGDATWTAKTWTARTWTARTRMWTPRTWTRRPKTRPTTRRPTSKSPPVWTHRAVLPHRRLETPRTATSSRPQLIPVVAQAHCTAVYSLGGECAWLTPWMSAAWNPSNRPPC